MLTEREKYGISELLDRMPARDLGSLAQTVTSRLIVPETPHEAISAIILHTDRPSDLLKRRKVKKEFLFRYLHAKRVAIETTDKPGMVSAVLQLWGSSTVGSSSAASIIEEDSLPEAPAPSRNTSHTSLCSLDYNGSRGGGGGSGSGYALLRNVVGSLPINPPESPRSMDDEDDKDDDDDGIDIGYVNGEGEDDRLQHSESLTPTTPPALLSSSYHSTSSSVVGVSAAAAAAAAATALLLSSSAPSSCYSYFSNHRNSSSMSPASSTTGSSPTAAAASSGVEEAYEMADSFVRWFYELLNSTFHRSERPEFGPQHFWVDASARINLQSATAKDVESICVQGDGRRTCDALRHVVQKYRVTYNPNTTRNGVSGRVDAHGLAMVAACGTLHNPANATVCGTFHQQFGLVRDPSMGNNWKIKFTNANLVSKESVSEVPCLANSMTLAPPHSPQQSNSAALSMG